MCSSMSPLDRVRPATLRISHARPADLPRGPHPGPVRADRRRVLAQRPSAAHRHHARARRLLGVARAGQPRRAGPRAFPARRAGDSGDAALAATLAGAFRAMGSYQVSTPSFQAETADGKRRLTTVIARQVGQPGPGLVVVAHRDALGRGARAELSGTAAMIELANVVRGGRLKRTVTFVSTSGGSAGLGGARDLVQRLTGRPGRGARARRPRRHDRAPPLRRRLVHRRRRRRAAAAPDRRGRRAQGGGHQPRRRARDVAMGAAGLPGHDRRAGAAGGRRPPGGAACRSAASARRRPATRSCAAACRRSGAPPCARSPRSTTRRRSAPRGSSRALVTMRKVLPLWAVRLLVAALLLAPMLVAVDGFARVRRRHEPVGPWVWWLVAAAAPVTRRAGLRSGCWASPGCCPPRRPSRWRPGRSRSGPRGRSALVAVALVALLGWIALRPALLRRTGGAHREVPRRGRGRRAARHVVRRWPPCCGCATPTPRRCSCPARTRCSPSIAPEVRLRRGLAVALVVVAAAPFLLVDLSLAGQLGLVAGGLRLVLRAARRRRRRRAAGLGHLEPRARRASSPRCSWRCAAGRAWRRRRRRRSPCAAPSATRARARWAAPSPRCGDEARARHRAGGRRAAGAGRRGRHARLAGAAQRPARGARPAPPRRAAARARARGRRRRSARRPRHAGRGARARSRALAPRRPGRGRAAHRAHRPARDRRARDLAGRPARGPGPHRRHAAARRSAARRRSPGTARPTAPRSATSTRCAAATRSRCACPTAASATASRAGGSSTPATSPSCAASGHDRLVLSACHPLFSAARRIVVLARLTGVGQSASSGRVTACVSRVSSAADRAPTRRTA